MFEVAQQFIIQLIQFMPGLIGLWLLFGFVGDLLFGNK